MLGYSLLDHESIIVYHAAKIQQDNIDMQYLTKITHDRPYLLVDQYKSLNDKSINHYKLINTNSVFEKNWRNWSVSSYRAHKSSKKLVPDTNPNIIHR